jgi:flagellar biosynthetic protein FliO
LVVFTLPVLAVDGELPGNLIDDLMKKNGGEATVQQVKTAESALPTRHEEKVEAKKETVKNIESTQPVFNNPASIAAVKAPVKSLWGKMILSLALVLSVFGGLIFAYRKWPGSKKIAQRAKMIEVLNQHHLGPKRSIAVIRVAGEAVLIGVTDHNITLLKTLSLLDDDVPEETREATFALKNDEAYKFEKTLSKKAAPTTREDEFSMQGLKEIIGDRLKNMKELR